jgi:hypothetical protein
MTGRPFTDENLRVLADVLRMTRPDELTCDEWLDRVGAYADALAVGAPRPPGAELIDHHLQICPECREEFEALLAALKGG